MRNYLIIIILLFAFALNQHSQAPTIVSPLSNIPLTVETTFEGPGVDIFNVTYTGHPEQIATFSGGLPKVGINDGIALTTGKSSYAASPNCAGCGLHSIPVDCGGSGDTGGQGGPEHDADLEALISNPDCATSSRCPAAIEFDFTTTGNSLEFTFVWASEEYPGYACSCFNDVFGIFLSGPGYTGGPYSGGSYNIALVPSTTVPISIQTINNGCTCLNTGPCMNCSYYKPNCFTVGDIDEFRYDGYTVPITVNLNNLECNQTYHIKIAITNINDKFYDSGIFIKKESFKSDFVAGPASAKPNPVCEGMAVTLECPGDPSYIYNWFNAQNMPLGSGQTLTIPANPNDPPYTVQVINPATQCSLSLIANTVIYVSNNTPPYTKGIDNTEEYIYYTKVCEPFSFNIYTFDDVNEEITFIGAPAFPYDVQATYFDNFIFPSGVNHPYVQISGTPYNVGQTDFNIILADHNPCSPIPWSQYHFRIIVPCPECNINVYYQNRGGTNVLLPAETDAIKFIVAGSNVDNSQPIGPVIVSPSENVTFRAGEKIKLEPGFSALAGSNFVAQIINNCSNICSDCCENWTGFTYDQPIPNVFTPNGDGVNDIWQVTDVNNPNCAYSALGFELEIAYGFNVHELVWKLSYLPEGYAGCSIGNCCRFKSVAPNNPIPHSSIYWDGTINEGIGIGNQVPTGTYLATLKLYGCNDVTYATQFYISVFN